MKFKPQFFLFLILLAIYWQWFLPGPRVATDFSQVSEEIIKARFNLPQTWSVFETEGLGEYTVFTMWSWQFNLFYAFFANLGLPFLLLERFLIIIPFLLFGSISIWKLLSRLNLSDYAKIIATFFYLSNSYILLVIDGGQLSISLSYALFPLCFLALEDAIKGSFKKSILLGFAVFLMGSFDIRFIYVFMLLAALRFLYEFLFLNFRDWKGWFFSWVKIGCISASIIIGLNFFWLYILYKAPLSSTFYAYLTQTSFEKLISLGHALFLLSPHWFKNVFGEVTALKWEFIGIPLLVFLAPILKPKNRHVGFWLLVALISIFLTKGASEPLSKIYPWFYLHVPGFSLFRDSSKFFFLITLSYTVLIGFSVNELWRKIKNYKLRSGVIITIMIYLVFIIRPVWLGWMTGTFSPPFLQKEYSQLNSLILNDKEESNVFWIPTISPLTILNPTHPSLEAARLASKRPFAQANLGSYEKFNFLREASYMGQLFNIANVGYIIYPPLDSRRDNMKADNVKYYDTFLNQLSNLPWLNRVNDSKIPLLKVSQHQDKLFIAPNVWWVIGSDSIYSEATKSGELTLSKNALIFTEESSELGKRLDGLPQAKIILNHKTSLDLAASFLSKSDLIFPAKWLKHDPDVSGWWKRETSDFIYWKDFLKTKYGINNQDFDLGGGWAIAEGSLELKIQYPKITKDQILLARVLESTKSGQINFYQAERLVGQINTKSPGDNIRWFEIGGLIGGSEVTIKTQGEINVVNSLALLPASLWQEYKDKAKSYEGRMADFGKGVLEVSSLGNYKQISPTKYMVTIANLKQPSLLIFSQNFDNNWKLNGESPVPVYSLLNGYSIKENGKYELTFEPQKYVSFGLVISAITLFAALLLLLV